MDALLIAFVAAALGEWGDKTQLLAAALAARYAKPTPILAGIALAALANSLIAAIGGAMLRDMVTVRALTLLLALALLFAGGAGLFRQKAPDLGATWKTGAFVTSAGCFFLLEFGDKTQFITAAISARFDAVASAAAGAAAGVLASSVPAVLLANRLGAVVPLQTIRLTVATLFSVTGLLVAITALRLI